MAYGLITGYEPHPEIPGAYNFITPSGPLTFGGPEAENLRNRIDASNAVNKVAGPGGGFDPKQAAADLTGVPPANQPMAPPPPQAESAAPSPQARPLTVNGINTGYEQGPDGRLYEHVEGTKGTSKKDIEKKANEGTALPTAQSQSVTGGFERDPTYEANKAAAQGVERGGIERQRGADLQAEAAGRDAAQQQFVAQTAQMDEQQKLVGQIQQQVDHQQAIRDQALKDYSSTKIDPERIYHGELGGLKRFGNAIAAAIGAWAAVKGGTENFAQKIIDNAINQDIHAQELDLHTKKDKADNALADLTRRGMSLDQAKNTLASIQRDWAKNQIMLARGASSDEAINARYDQMIGRLDQQNLNAAEDDRRKSLGTATKAVQAQIVYPHAGRAGGLRAVAPSKALGIAGTTAGTEGTVASTAGTIKKLGESGNGVKGGTKKAAQLADIDATDAALSEFEKYHTERGKPGVLATGVLGGDTSQHLGSMAESLAPGLGRAMEGNAPNESTMKAIREGLLSPSGEKISTTIGEYRKRLRERRKAIMEGPDEGSGGGEEPKHE